jgi:hypothetical protein
MKIKIDGFGQAQNVTLAGFVTEDFLNKKRWSDESRKALLVQHGSADRRPQFIFKEVTEAELPQVEVLRKKLKRLSGTGGDPVRNFSTTYSIHSICSECSPGE